MDKNGTTVRWVGIIVGLFVLAFGIMAAAQSGIVKRVEVNEVDIRRVDKQQAVIIYQLESIDTKIDQLLEAD